MVHQRFLKFSLISSTTSFVPSIRSYCALNVVINVCHEQEQEQKLMKKKMMIEELRCHEATATPPARLFYTEYLQVDDRSILSLLPNEVVAILPATLDDEDQTLVAVLRSRKQ